MPKTRQLAAIMFTDIQGYTAMMQKDEGDAVRVRGRHREIFASTTQKYQGKILQYYGDGTLSIFDSAVEAVQCGIELQFGFQQEPKIPVRVGIHLGDIIYDEQDVIGDGVNVASRIEALGVTGSVVISDKVNDELKNQTTISTLSLGIFELKNVKDAVEVFAVTSEGLVVPKGRQMALKKEKVKWASRSVGRIVMTVVLALAVAWGVLQVLPLISELGITDAEVKGEKSLAVLPFNNMSNDPEQEYFSDGISEEILNALAKIPELKVAGRTSSFAFKGRNEDLRTIGEKLNVNMVLEGSVRKSGDQVRITAQLINVEDGYHIWSEQYDRELQNIFAVQEEIASNIVAMLKLTVLDSDQVGPPPTSSIDAYEAYLKGRFFLSKDYDGTLQALEYFNRALEIDPNFAEASAARADAYLNIAFYGIMPLTVALDSAKKEALISISLDPKLDYGHRILAYCYLFGEWDWIAAKREYDRAVELGLPTPNHFINFYDAWLFRNHDKAIADAILLSKRDPLSIEAYWHVGLSYFYAERIEEAIIAFKQSLELNPNYSEGHRWIGICHGIMGRYKEAEEALQKALDLTGGHGPARLNMLGLQAKAGGDAKAREIIKELQKTEGNDIDVALMIDLYMQLGDLDQVFMWMERAYDQKSKDLLTLKSSSRWDPIRTDPRFQDLFERMNFPE